MPQRRRSRSRDGFGPGSLLERARHWSEARVTFDRLANVHGRCPRCEGLLTRRLGPGVMCGTCGRLWIVRELLEQDAGRHRGAA
jgi:hypothetical protein